MIYFLLRCSLFLLTATLLLELLVRGCRLKSAAMHRVIWGAALLVSLLGFAIPIAVPVVKPVVRESETLVHSSPESLAVPTAIPQQMPQFADQNTALPTPMPAVAIDALPLSLPQLFGVKS